jgi:hypothetical protein
VEALAPGVRLGDVAGENDADQPLGTVAEMLNADAAQDEPLLFLTVTVNRIWPAAAMDTAGA